MMNSRTKKLGKYEIKQRLGKGGMGEVYKGLQPRMGRSVAIKVMYKHLLDETDSVERFRREAKGGGLLRHRNIVRVIDFDRQDGLYYLVLEYLAGETLEAHLNQRTSLSAQEALKIVAQLADALAYAHQRGIIHRDIKPTNIMFTNEKLKCPVLTDFGMARVLHDTQMTLTGAMIGTPAYMSPEALRGEEVDHRSDLYSLGVVLYEMVVGKKPYSAKSPYGMMFKRLHKPLPAPRKLNPSLPKCVERLILKALAPNVADRYQSAQLFYNAIQQTLTDLQAKPPRLAHSEGFSSRLSSSAKALISCAVGATSFPTILKDFSALCGEF